MGARQKLNQSFFTGSLILATLIGWLAESWWVFFVALLILVGLNLCAREIRPGKPPISPPRTGPPSTNEKDGSAGS